MAQTSIMARLEALKAAEGGAPKAPAAEPVVEPTAQEHAQGYMGPPRYACRGVVEPFEVEDTCKACSGSGKNSQGGYCVCPLGTRRYTEEKNPHLGSPVDEFLKAEEKPEAAPELTEKKPDPTVAESAGSSAASTRTPAPTPPAPSPGATLDTAPAKKRGRPKKVAEAPVPPAPAEPLLAVDLSSVPDQRVSDEPDFMILYNCSVVKGGDGVTAGQLLRIAVEEIGGSTLEDYYKQDTWARRSTLKGIGKKLAERVSGGAVLAGPYGANDDEAAAVAAIAPYSSIEIGARA